MRRRFFILISLSLFLTGCGYAGPEKAVRYELDLIRKLDDSTIQSFISYEEIQMTNGISGDIGNDTIDAVKLFFKNFDYDILSSSQSKDGTTADVTVQISNIDSKLLARDLCKELIRINADYTQPSMDYSLSSYFSLMKKFLSENEYPVRTSKATFHLKNQNEHWVIEESAQLEDELVGGLVSYLSDSYLLAPDEVLSLILDQFSAFDAQDWISYLGISDVFAVGSDASSELDQLFASQLSGYFDYQIRNSWQDDDVATVSVDITSLDMNSVIEDCKEDLLQYASSTESVRATDEELSRKTAEILTAALEANTASSVTPLTVTMQHSDHTWDPVFDDSFTDALLGNLNSALLSLNNEAAD